MDGSKQTESTLEQLVWQVDAGADEAIEEQAGMLHWQVVGAAKGAEPARGFSAQALETVLKGGDKPAAPRRASRPVGAVVDKPPESVKATSLSELKAEIEAFDGCGLKKTAMNLVFADGNPDADILILGDAPAGDDDRQGQPFQGSHGVLLDKMLASIGLDRDKTYLTNMVFWRPPGGRAPTQEEIEACLPFVHQHITLLQPKMIICLGGLAVKNLLRRKETFSKLRGRWAEYKPLLADEKTESISCIATHPPGYLLRLPAFKRQAWQDLLKIKKKLTD